MGKSDVRIECHPRRRRVVCLALYGMWLAVATVLPLALSARASAAPVPAPPEPNATAWLLQDFHSGQVIAQHDADARVEPASLTKMMTAYVVFAEIAAGKVSLDDEVLISEKAWKMPGSRMFVEVDKRVSVLDLLKGVVIQSGNDASVALSEHVAGDEAAFSDLMNQYAARVGMTSSHFTNSSGLPDPEHYTTARDMALMAEALIRDFPEQYGMHAQKQFVFNGITQYNRNRLLWSDSGVDGLKTGHTQAAGYCLVASATRDGMRLISVMMGAESERSRARQSQALLSYGFRFYETHRLYAAGAAVQEVRVWKGDRDTVGLGLGRDLYITVPRGQYERLTSKMLVDALLEAPLVEGDLRGELQVSFDGELVASRRLQVLATVPPGSILRRLTDSVLMWFQ